MTGGHLLGTFGPSGGSSRGMHHGMVAIGLKAFTPTDRMAAVLPHRDNCWGSAQCSPVTMHAIHAHRRGSMITRGLSRSACELLPAVSPFPAGRQSSPVVAGGWVHGGAAADQEPGFRPASQTERKIPFVGTWKGFTCAECLRAKALSMCQREGHVLEVGPWI